MCQMYIEPFGCLYEGPCADSAFINSIGHSLSEGTPQDEDTFQLHEYPKARLHCKDSGCLEISAR